MLFEVFLFNSFATAEANMRQYFHCLQWYAGSERVNKAPELRILKTTHSEHRTDSEESRS